MSDEGKKITELDLVTTPATDDTFAGVQGGANYEFLTSQILRTPVDVHNVMHYGATGDGATDDAAAIQEAIDAAFAAGGGRVYIPTGTYLLSSSLTFRKSVSISGVFPGVTPDSLRSWDLGFTVSSGTIITFPGGTVFVQDMTGGLGTLSNLDGVIIESLGFDDVESIITSGETSKSGLDGCVIRDIRGSNVSGVAFDLINPMHLNMQNVKVGNVYQFLRITADYDDAVIDNEPGNSYFADLYAFVTAAGHSQPTIHLRALDPSGNGGFLNYCHFVRIQVNKMESTDLTGHHLLVEGAGADQLVNYCVFDDCDFEGYTDTRISLTNTFNAKINFSGFASVGRANADFCLRSANYTSIVSCDPGVVLDMDAGSTPSFFSGAMEEVVVGSKYPIGVWYEHSTGEVRSHFVKYSSKVATALSDYPYGMTMPIRMQNFTAGGGIGEYTRSIAGDGVLDVYEFGYIELTNAGDQAITLMDATACAGHRVTLKKTGAAGVATIAGAGGQTIDGAANNIWLDTQYKYITLQSNGSNWLIVAKG